MTNYTQNYRIFYIGIGNISLNDENGVRLFEKIKDQLLEQNKNDNGILYTDYFVPIEGHSCDIKIHHMQINFPMVNTTFPMVNTTFPFNDPNYTGTPAPPQGSWTIGTPET